jgi:nucleotide-binding universal stress UspA family protein
MTYATVMVSLALGQSNGARLELAGELAERFGAGLVGVAAAQFSPPLYYTTGAEAQSLIEEGQAAVERRLAELEVEFRQATRNRGGPVDWRGALDFPARFIAQQARCADIVVSGGVSPAFSDSFALASPKDLVMQLGRPLLLVPDTANWLDLRSVLVAWKDTPESRRAIRDALPLLRKAREITVAEIAEEEDEQAAALSRIGDVASWLSRHGVTATLQVPAFVAGRSAAAQLDDIAGNVGANLVVAGAYGHSRLRELVLGGVTQHLVTQSERCVLLSH